MIIDLFKTELMRLYGKDKPDLLQEMRDIVSQERLIGRDDQRKFDNMSEEERLKETYM